MGKRLTKVRRKKLGSKPGNSQDLQTDPKIALNQSDMKRALKQTDPKVALKNLFPLHNAGLSTFRES